MSSTVSPQPHVLRILHFNDVYNVNESPKEAMAVGGAPRFAALLKHLRGQTVERPMVTFGGDALSPSESTCLVCGRWGQPFSIAPHIITVFEGLGCARWFSLRAALNASGRVC
jgi:hypothetical protein